MRKECTIRDVATAMHKLMHIVAFSCSFLQCTCMHSNYKTVVVFLGIIKQREQFRAIFFINFVQILILPKLPCKTTSQLANSGAQKGLLKQSSCNSVPMPFFNTSIMNFIKSPKNWSARTNRTGSYAYATQTTMPHAQSVIKLFPNDVLCIMYLNNLLVPTDIQILQMALF